MASSRRACKKQEGRALDAHCEPRIHIYMQVADDMITRINQPNESKSSRISGA